MGSIVSDDRDKDTAINVANSGNLPAPVWYDGRHYEFNANPTRWDTDGDGWSDLLELRGGTDVFLIPFDEPLHSLQLGFISGEDADPNDPATKNLLFLAAHIASNFLIYGSIRDAYISHSRGDDVSAFIYLISIIPAAELVKLGEPFVAPVFQYAAGTVGNVPKLQELLVGIAKLSNVVPEEKIVLLDAALRGAGQGDAIPALINRGVKEERVFELAAKADTTPINFAKHADDVGLLKAARNAPIQPRLGKGSDVAVIFTGKKPLLTSTGETVSLATKYPAEQGYKTFYNNKLYGFNNSPLGEIDVVIAKDNKLVAFGQVKSVPSSSAFTDAESQIASNLDLIKNGEIKGVGNNLDLASFKIENIKETFTVGPKDAPFAYTYKLPDNSFEFEEIYQSWASTTR